MKMQKGSIQMVIGIIVAVLAIGGGAYYMVTKQPVAPAGDPNEIELSTTTTSNQESKSKVAPASTAKDQPLTVPALSNLTIDQLLNLSYGSNDREMVEAINFVNGVHYYRFTLSKYGKDVAVTDYPNSGYVIIIDRNKIAFGDVDADGDSDAAFVTSESQGGSGNFKAVHVVRNHLGKPIYVGSFGLGDRTVINSIDIIDGLIRLDLLTHDSGEPLCCPTTAVSKKLKLVDARIVEVK